MPELILVRAFYDSRMSGTNQPQVVTVLCDGSAACALLDELRVYLDHAPTLQSLDNAKEILIGSLQPFSQMIRVELDDDPTLGAGQLRVLLNPSDSLREFVAALRASYIERDVSI